MSTVFWTVAVSIALTVGTALAIIAWQEVAEVRRERAAERVSVAAELAAAVEHDRDVAEMHRLLDLIDVERERFGEKVRWNIELAERIAAEKDREVTVEIVADSTAFADAMLRARRSVGGAA